MSKQSKGQETGSLSPILRQPQPSFGKIDIDSSIKNQGETIFQGQIPLPGGVTKFDQRPSNGSNLSSQIGNLNQNVQSGLLQSTQNLAKLQHQQQQIQYQYPQSVSGIGDVLESHRQSAESHMLPVKWSSTQQQYQLDQTNIQNKVIAAANAQDIINNEEQQNQVKQDSMSNPYSKKGGGLSSLGAAVSEMEDAKKQMNLDHDIQIRDLEVKKHSLYLNFINELAMKKLYMEDYQKSNEFVRRYFNLFSEIQGKFLNLYNKQLITFAEQPKKQQSKGGGVGSHQHQQNISRDFKDQINKKIVQNMIEILNYQILLNLVSTMFEKHNKNNHDLSKDVSDASKQKEKVSVSNSHPIEDKENSNKDNSKYQGWTQLHKMSPIEMGLFMKIVPKSYTRCLHSQIMATNQSHQFQEPQVVDVKDKISKYESEKRKNEPPIKQEEEVVEQPKPASGEKEEVKDKVMDTRVETVIKFQPQDQEGLFTEKQKEQLTDAQAQQQILSQLQQMNALNPINEINESTFKQIANSLSPEPEKLFQQQMGRLNQNLNLCDIKFLTGQLEGGSGAGADKKRSADNSAALDKEYQKLQSDSKKQKLSDDGGSQQVGPKKSEAASESIHLVVDQQVEQANSPKISVNQSVQKEEEEREAERQSIEANGKNEIQQEGQIIEGLNLEVVQDLLQHYQDNQIGQFQENKATPFVNIGKSQNSVLMPSRAGDKVQGVVAGGVQVGGFRQTAYSDSHQEIIKTMSRLNAENLNLISNTKKDQQN